MWETVEVPALRVVDEALWDLVNQRPKAIAFKIGGMMPASRSTMHTAGDSCSPASSDAASVGESIKAEAAEVLRGLIDRIELLPHDDGPGIDVRLYGELATILAFCEESDHKEKLPGTGVPGSQLSVVAGAGSVHCHNFPAQVVNLGY